MNANSKERRDTAQPEEGYQVELKSCQRELKECWARVEQLETLLAYTAEREKTFAEGKRAEDQLRMMIDTIPTLAWSCRPDGTTEFLNQRWLDYTGLSFREALGWGWKVPVHPEDLKRLMAMWRSLLVNGEPGGEEARLRRFDGEYRWFLFRAVPVRDEQGAVVRWYGTNTDIEDLKRAEERHQGDQRQIRRIIDVIPQQIVVLGPDGETLYANQAVLDYTGLSIEEVQREDFRVRVFHSEDVAQVRDERQKALARGAPFELE
jgi:PAS domain S-box-containing protein